MRDLSQNPQADMPVTSEFGMDSTIDIERPSSQHERGLLNNLLKRHTAQMATAQSSTDSPALIESQVIQLHAQLVARHDGGTFTAKASDGQELFPVKKAFSCLHEVLVVDHVLVSGSIRDGFYVLAIIERPAQDLGTEPQATTILQLGENVRLNAGHLAIEAQSHQLSVQNFQVIAQQYHVNSTQVSYRGQTMQYYAAQLDENYAHAKRFVAGSDTVHALNFEYIAEQTARIHGLNTFINGEKLLKSDGQLMMVG